MFQPTACSTAGSWSSSSCTGTPAGRGRGRAGGAGEGVGKRPGFAAGWKNVQAAALAEGRAAKSAARNAARRAGSRPPARPSTQPPARLPTHPPVARAMKGASGTQAGEARNLMETQRQAARAACARSASKRARRGVRPAAAAYSLRGGAGHRLAATQGCRLGWGRPRAGRCRPAKQGAGAEAAIGGRPHLYVTSARGAHSGGMRRQAGCRACGSGGGRGSPGHALTLASSAPGPWRVTLAAGVEGTTCDQPYTAIQPAQTPHLQLPQKAEGAQVAGRQVLRLLAEAHLLRQGLLNSRRGPDQGCRRGLRPGPLGGARGLREPAGPLLGQLSTCPAK